jgi:tRNA A58 N-methylase Trm61
MARMVYKHKNYRFENEDDRVFLDPDEYFKFVENCKKSIKEDKNLETISES